MDDNGVYGNDAADGQTACIAHEYLCRVGVVPEEADKCTDESADKDYQLFRTRYVHDVQITGIFDMAGYVCQYAQCQTDNGGGARCHAVHAVIQVGAVGNGGYYEYGDEHEQYPARRLCVFSHERHEVGIVKVVALEERDGSLCSLDFFGGMYYLDALSRFLYLDVFTDNDLRTEIQGKPYNESQAYLADNLELTVQAFLVFLEYLDVIVGKS